MPTSPDAQPDKPYDPFSQPDLVIPADEFEVARRDPELPGRIADALQYREQLIENGQMSPPRSVRQKPED